MRNFVGSAIVDLRDYRDAALKNFNHLKSGLRSRQVALTEEGPRELSREN